MNELLKKEGMLSRNYKGMNELLKIGKRLNFINTLRKSV